MNRAQRRSAKRKQKYPVIELPANHGIPEGSLVTIAGIGRSRSGRTIANCKPGTETVFVVRIRKT